MNMNHRACRDGPGSVSCESRQSTDHNDNEDDASRSMRLKTMISSSCDAASSSSSGRNRPMISGASNLNRSSMMGMLVVAIVACWAGSSHSQQCFVSGFSSSPPRTVGISSSSRPTPLKLKGSQQHYNHGVSQLWMASNAQDMDSNNAVQIKSKQQQQQQNPNQQYPTKKKSKYKKYKKKDGKYYKGKHKGYNGGGNGGGYSNGGNGSGMHFNAARAFNSHLTKCNSVSELLSSFMTQTSSAGEGASASSASASSSSAATHLAGANKANSVNFSTCLHRLARFAAKSGYNNNNNQNNRQGGNRNQNQNQQVDERKKVLADPRFALLVCSMAEMAAGCDADRSVKEGNDALEAWKKGTSKSDASADAGEMRAADDLLNAIAGASSKDKVNVNVNGDAGEVSAQSSDSSTNLAAEVMAKVSTPRAKNAFSSRECSNVCWALAKLQMAPPSTALPLGRVVQANGNDNKDSSPAFASMDEMALDTIASSLKVRMQLFEEARNRKQGAPSQGLWIPELSRLAGKVLDLIGEQTIRDYSTRSSVQKENLDGRNSNRGSSFNPQEMASVLWAFAKSKRGNALLFSTVAQEMMRQTRDELQKGGQGPKPQELSNTIWAFATAGIRGDTQVELVKFIADALDEGDGLFFGFQFKPQELSNTAWALATLHSKRNKGEVSAEEAAAEDDGIVRILRWVAKFMMEHMDSFKPQEISNSIWAFSTIGFGYDEACGTNSHNDYVHVATDDSAGDKELVYETLEVIAQNALPRLDRFKAQELNNMAWGFARLGHRTERAEKLFAGVADQLIQRTWQFKPQDVGTTLWSFATAEHFNLDAFRAGVSRLNLRHIRTFKPQEMSNTVWALATAGFAPQYIRAFDTTLVPASQRPTKEMIMKDPITECFAAVASETMRRPYDFKDQELKDVLWSFSKIGVRHPALFQKIAKHIVGRNGRGFSSFSSQGLGNTMWSFAKQAQLSLEVIDDLGDKVKLVSTGRLAVYETSCLDNGEEVIKRLFVRAAEAGMDIGLDRFTNQDLSNTVWAYSTLGMLHAGFFKQTENEVLSRLQQKRVRFRGQEIANILWSFATLNAQPDVAMVDAFSTYIAAECRGKNGIDEISIARLFTQRQELANLAWSCAVIGRYPKELMDILYTGLVGTSNDPEQMKHVFNDDGLQKSSIMTLYYVQVAADVEATDLKLSLPAGFPNGWGEDKEDNRAKGDNDLIEMSSSMLTLTVSKLQKDVSRTYDKIGFANILEHVIDTNEIKDEYGIQLPHSPKEFLSIDIANIDKQIGIEVDGPGHFVRLIDNPGKSTSKVSLENQFDDRGENRVNGPTILKHRLLTHLGWDIIHLPYWEYQELGGDKNKEMDYCQSLLEQSSKW